MPSGYQDDHNAAFARGEATRTLLEERHSRTLDYCDRDTPTRFDTLDQIKAHLSTRIAPDIAHHRPGWGIDVVEAATVRGPQGALAYPAVVIHHAQNLHSHAAAIALRSEPYAVPHSHTIREVAILGVDAFNARVRTAAAAQAWETTSRIAGEIAHLADEFAGPHAAHMAYVAAVDAAPGDGAALLQAWVHCTGYGYFSDDQPPIVTRHAVNDDAHLGGRLWEPFTIWDPANATLQIAHLDTSADGAPPRVIAALDHQSALNAASARAVASAAALTLHDELKPGLSGLSWDSDTVEPIVPVLYDPESPGVRLRCHITEPDVALIEGAMRPPRNASLGLIADPSDPTRHAIWAARLPDPSRTCADITL